MSNTTTRFALIRTASHNGSFSDREQVPTPEGTTYFVRRISTSTRRGMYGLIEVAVYGVTDGESSNYRPLTWATREAAEAVAAKHTSDYATYAVLPLDVVDERSAYGVNVENEARRVSAATPGSWVEIKGSRCLVLRASANA